MSCNDGKAEGLEGSTERAPANAFPVLTVSAQRVMRRLQSGSRLVSAVADHGLRYAYHLQREARAVQQGRRADMGPHLLARLNLAGAQRGTRVKALLDGLGLRDVAEIDYALLERQGERAVVLVRELSLIEATDLYTYFRYFGDFRTASWLRIRFLEAHLREQERAAEVSPAALAAALEQARPDLVLQIVESKRTLALHRATVEEAVALARALLGDVERAVRTWSLDLSASDIAFGDAVRGRSIAIVGPAPASRDLASEIDSFDLVARTNYLRPVDARYGSRTDISYYNGIRQRTREQDIRAVASQLSWLVSVRSDDASLREMLPGHPGIRAGYRVNRLFVNARPLAMPNILADLIRFQPQRIKLFGVDFFTSPNAYGKEYHAHVVGSDAVSHSIRVHEGFSSFRFVQQLRRAGFCEAEPSVDQILSMSREQYAARLQEVHGHCTVANENPQKKWHGRPYGG